MEEVVKDERDLIHSIRCSSAGEWTFAELPYFLRMTAIEAVQISL